MAFVSWKEAYNTGNEEIDAQHKQIFEIINELYDSRHSQGSREVIDGILSKLTDYAAEHFSAEEALLEKMNYPKLEEHKAEHQNFRNRIKEILGHQTEEQFRTEDMLVTFLKGWLAKHILDEDMKALSFKG